MDGKCTCIFVGNLQYSVKAMKTCYNKLHLKHLTMNNAMDKKVGLKIIYICNSYNMGTSDLPEIYARARGRAAPECKCVYFRQIKSAHVITNISHCG